MPKTTLVIEAEEVIRELERIGASVPKRLEAAAEAAAEVIRDAARENVGSQHIEMDTVKSRQYEVEVDVGPDKEHWYLKFFETGAQPHEIFPNQALAVTVSEDDVRAYVLNHPGMAAEPFLRPAFDENQEKAQEAAGEELMKGIEGR